MAKRGELANAHAVTKKDGSEFLANEFRCKERQQLRRDG
jgi:hypothetical protein